MVVRTALGELSWLFSPCRRRNMPAFLKDTLRGQTKGIRSRAISPQFTVKMMHVA